MGDHMHFWSRFKQLFNRRHADRHEVKAAVDLEQAWESPSTDSKYSSVDLKHAKGVTHYLSDTGVYFETDVRLENDWLIRFKINFDSPRLGNRTQLECMGRILRVDQLDMGKLGVAVRLNEQHLRTVGV